MRACVRACVRAGEDPDGEDAKRRRKDRLLHAELSRTETVFEFGPYLLKFVHHRTVGNYVSLLATWDTNPRTTNHYCVRFLKRVADMGTMQVRG